MTHPHCRATDTFYSTIISFFTFRLFSLLYVGFPNPVNSWKSVP